MTDRELMQQALEAMEALRERLAQPEQEPATIWYMRDNHTFKRLSADVSTALIEIEQEFNEGYTYGMLCSKHKGFSTVHASGEKKRLEFFAECKKTLEEWLPNTTPPQRSEPSGKPSAWVGLTDGDVNYCVDAIYKGFDVKPRNEIEIKYFERVIKFVEAKLKEKNT